MTAQGNDAGPALFRLVRFWTRRWAPGAAGEVNSAARDDTGEHADVQHVYVVEAIDTATRAAEGGEVTVADVAHLLGLDRSVASRMIGYACAAGYVHRQTSATDARRANVVLTESGTRFLAASHAFQQRTFDDLVANWPEDDQRRFAEYLRRLADQVLGSR
ncbi:MarR family transcriptional regulator [Prauserella marina]|uniref:DNA-binding transcriptional regulator, MarR family n=1 Tax=Prauserella marina TaxID=530584 RepID=A0A222VMQ0_9PSEU|nr:MarR family winged helix-turn-helix transcriptional regulator [Prauserella marina]ASR35200.1 MarR family transcriptional regulator [Prauserella marina]PWV85033.1 MarR family transcriptional regulator [Prauserella marina]SDC06352.1 DNA-binding transcriptional regulator, MarR family [Prauserella marina]